MMMSQRSRTRFRSRPCCDGDYPFFGVRDALRQPRCRMGSAMRNPSTQLTPSPAEIRVQIIEQCGAALQTLCVRHPGGTQSVNQAGNAACLLTREFAVLQVDVVDDFADCG